MTELRRTVNGFAHEMEKKLRKFDQDRGMQGWEDAGYMYLFQRMDEEMIELLEAFESRDVEKIMSECIDVANFGMMIYDKCTREKDIHRAMSMVEVDPTEVIVRAREKTGTPQSYHYGDE